MWSIGGIILTEGNPEFGENPVPVILCEMFIFV
jgi:hypothetical protein